MNNYQYFIVRCSLLFVAFMKFFRFKILFLFFILAVFGLPEIFSQTSDTATKVVTVLSPQNFYLDSRFISNINGRSRLAIPIKLPENTVKCFFSFAAHESKNETLHWVSLAGQLTRIIDKTGISAHFIEALINPIGTAVCDIYVIDTAQIKSFENKEDKNWTFDKLSARKNITSGITEINPNFNIIAIAFNNPSLKSGINIQLEVSAIVTKDGILPKNMVNKGMPLPVSVENIYKDSIIHKIDSLEKIGNFVEMRNQTYNFLLSKSEDNKIKIPNARALFLSGHAKSALSVLQPLSDKFPDNLHIQAQLAHSYLFCNEPEKAEKIYYKHTLKETFEGERWEELIASDFYFFIQNKFFNSHYENILKKLKVVK